MFERAESTSRLTKHPFGEKNQLGQWDEGGRQLRDFTAFIEAAQSRAGKRVVHYVLGNTQGVSIEYPDPLGRMPFLISPSLSSLCGVFSLLWSIGRPEHTVHMGSQCHLQILVKQVEPSLSGEECIYKQSLYTQTYRS